MPNVGALGLERSVAVHCECFVTELDGQEVSPSRKRAQVPMTGTIVRTTSAGIVRGCSEVWNPDAR